MYCIKHCNASIDSSGGSFGFNSNNDLYISDVTEKKIRKIDNTGAITTLSNVASFTYPQSVLCDMSGIIPRIGVMDSIRVFYILDNGSSTKITFINYPTGHINPMRYNSTKRVIFSVNGKTFQISSPNPSNPNVLTATTIATISTTSPCFALDNSDNIYFLNSLNVGKINMSLLDSSINASSSAINYSYYSVTGNTTPFNSINIFNGVIYLTTVTNLYTCNIDKTNPTTLLSYATDASFEIINTGIDYDGNMYTYKKSKTALTTGYIYKLQNYVVVQPTITSITPNSNLLNSLTVNYSTSGGIPSPTYYYYSLDSSGLVQVDNTPFIIRDLSSGSHTVSITAKAVDSDSLPVWTSTSSLMSESPYVVGTKSVIQNITPGINSLTIYFTESSGGNPSQILYSYSLNNIDFALINNNGVYSSQFTLNNLQSGTYPVSIKAGGYDSVGVEVWSIISDISYASPYTVGSASIITNISPGINSLSVSYTISSGGNPSQTLYYYSLDSSQYSYIGAYSSPFTIPDVPSGIYEVSIKTVGYVADVSAIWNIISNTSTGIPYNIGSAPTIRSILPGIQSLNVSFSGSTGGNPSPMYYYSVDSSGLILLGPTDSSFIIHGLSAGFHTVSITAKSFDSDSRLIWSTTSIDSSGIPYTVGSAPTITSIVPGTNSLTVSFADSSGGYDTAVHYYSYFADGSNRVGPVTSPFTISSVTEQQTIYIIATNAAGMVVSDASSGTPYIFGSAPIVSLTSGRQRLTVTYSQQISGTMPTYFFYSINKGPLIPAGESPFDINGLTSSYGYNLYILARNAAGDISSNSVFGNISDGYPYSMNLQRYCDNAVCQKQITYSRVKTGVNDPSISQKMQYARYVRGPVGKCTKVLDANGNIIG